MNDLLRAVYDARLIQFGLFREPPGLTPVRFGFEMLASYPQLLLRIARSVPPPQGERLLCTHDALPFAVALSLEQGIPLVYPQFVTDHWDLVGAYDIGHPTVLVTNVRGFDEPISTLVTQARRVGLHVTSMTAIVDTGHSMLPEPATHLFTLEDIVRDLVEARELPVGQAKAVRDWSAEGPPPRTTG